jgi:uncharacterized protein (TIGR03083 family)
MALPRTTVTEGTLREYGQFAALLRSLDERDWGAPSRCAGWTAADVAAHVSGLLADVVAGRLDGLGTPEMTQREVDERRGRSPGELADEIEVSAKVAADLLAGFDDAAWDGPAPPGVPGTLGDGVEALWYDAYLHADDIRAATGRPSERSASLEAAVSHVATVLDSQAWGPATLALDGVEKRDVGGGGGRHITGDALEFVLAATGRADPGPLGLDADVNIYR